LLLQTAVYRAFFAVGPRKIIDSCYLQILVFSPLIYRIAYPTENLPHVSLRFFSFRKPADSPVSDRQKAGFIKTSAQPQTRSEKNTVHFYRRFYL